MLIGLTGGIASGKSTVSNILKDIGIPVIDADLIAREVVKPGKPAWQKIVNTFGNEVLLPNQQLDREKLSQIIFENSKAKEKLDQITHPEIIREIKKRIDSLQTQGEEVIVADIPLLIETGMVEFFDEIWVVYVSRQTQLKRLINRDEIDYQTAVNKIEAQMPLEEKKEYADRLIVNEGDKGDLEDTIISIWREINAEKNCTNCP
ncbi:dephospho-CoA kinase [Acetohalobium arabaticum]|uniref:Dephospho-CoA kinase n=1 Tax=Acetohalobium arabaticum (strain ATCC 49924 / DSM 5501 / Z-7288) TaxID=574087 RepID=D9QU99_ACEAZ|nr:dephospho-CoA kinase [Acetohalobium arabaticum]ADL11892.1 dephospho-CoA kinase [Acetohalobium arabaticum DSM 5501]